MLHLLHGFRRGFRRGFFRLGGWLGRRLDNRSRFLLRLRSGLLHRLRRGLWLLLNNFDFRQLGSAIWRRSALCARWWCSSRWRRCRWRRVSSRRNSGSGCRRWRRSCSGRRCSGRRRRGHCWCSWWCSRRRNRCRHRDRWCRGSWLLSRNLRRQNGHRKSCYTDRSRPRGYPQPRHSVHSPFHTGKTGGIARQLRAHSRF